MHMINVAVHHGYLLVLLAWGTCFKGVYINPYFLCLFGLFVCFDSFFPAHFSISNCTLFVVTGFLVSIYPRFAQFVDVSVCFSLAFGSGVLCPRVVMLCSVSYLSFAVFSAIFMLVSPLSRI